MFEQLHHTVSFKYVQVIEVKRRVRILTLTLRVKAKTYPCQRCRKFVNVWNLIPRNSILLSILNLTSASGFLFCKHLFLSPPFQVSELERTSDVSLFVSGKPVDATVDLASLDQATVDVTVPLKGGKVHGSLARAGKVRGQTPKVEAQEKKKKKTGRAKRRIQYNRRFVNVVATFGRKKGPNSNS